MSLPLKSVDTAQQVVFDKVVRGGGKDMRRGRGRGETQPTTSRIRSLMLGTSLQKESGMGKRGGGNSHFSRAIKQFGKHRGLKRRVGDLDQPAALGCSTSLRRREKTDQNTKKPICDWLGPADTPWGGTKGGRTNAFHTRRELLRNTFPSPLESFKKVEKKGGTGKGGYRKNKRVDNSRSQRILPPDGKGGDRGKEKKNRGADTGLESVTFRNTHLQKKGPKKKKSRNSGKMKIGGMILFGN